MITFLKSGARNSSGRKRVLIVNGYFDDARQAVPRTNKIPHAMAPVYLAGAFCPERCEVRVHEEMFSGPLEDPALLGWPDMLVLTGLTMALDRMLHLTAYARSLRKDVVVVAGGPSVRAFPCFARRFFDYACLGDVEQMQEVIAEAFGPAYVAEQQLPRFDLAYWIGLVGHLESSRNCNFRCSFCSVGAEGRGYLKYDLDFIRRQIVAIGRKKFLLFIDNNFFGNDRGFFLERMELLREMRRGGWFEGWGALVTNDFFFQEENLPLARDAGCLVLFSGVESFDNTWLEKMNKRQNTRWPQTEMIRRCLESGIVFLYGLMLDVTSRRLADLRRELEFITGTPEITLPGYLSIPIPLPGTPYFYDCLREGRLLPGTRVRDLNSTTLSLLPLDPLEVVQEFVRDLQTLRGYRRRAFRHAAALARRYWRRFTPWQMTMALGNLGELCAYEQVTAPESVASSFRRNWSRTYVSTTEPLDAVYRPAFPLAARYERYFRPTMLIDRRGHLAEEVAEDVLAQQKAQRKSETALVPLLQPA